MATQSVLNFSNLEADLFVPDGQPLSAALQRITHLGVGAHPDDLEFMAFHGIEACFGQPDLWFGGVTAMNGAGSPRAGIYAQVTNDQMRVIRRREQRLAATLGRYAVMLQLDYPGSLVESVAKPGLVSDLMSIFMKTRPRVVYTHNLMDKHVAHVAVAICVILALRQLPSDQRPKQVYGCEGWRNLDWLPDREKVALNVSRRENLFQALAGAFDSQITGGKRYDLAMAGRYHANATMLQPHEADQATALTFALDLTPLVRDDALGIKDYVAERLRHFETEVTNILTSQLPA